MLVRRALHTIQICASKVGHYLVRLSNKDGKAQVGYAVRWSARNANLHGFYFEGFQEEPVFDYDSAYAEDNTSSRDLSLPGFSSFHLI